MKATNAEARRTVAYVRVSTDEQANEGYSLDAQERQARAYAVARAWPEVAEVYADAGVSGATRERPALNRLLGDAQKGTVGRLIITKLDRIGRRAADILAIEEELEQRGVERVYIKDAIDTSTPVGRMLRTVLAAVAELERDMILERTWSGYVEKAEKGEVFRARQPYGYIYTPGTKRNGLTGQLAPDPETAAVVRRIFESIASGMSAASVAVQLTAEGIASPRTRGRWGHTTILAILHNTLYEGRATFGRTRNVRNPVTGKTVNRRNDPEAVRYIAVPAIVTPELAAQARAQLTANQATSRRNAKHAYLLGGGKLTCGMPLDDGTPCGHVLHGEERRGRWYRCTYIGADARRRHHTLSAPTLEEALWTALCTLLQDPSHVLAEMDALATAGSAASQRSEAILLRLARQREAIATQQERLLDLYLQAGLDASTFASKNADLAKKRDDLDKQAAEQAARRDAALAQVLPLDDVRAACALVAQGLDHLTFDERQHIVRTLCRRIVATRGGLSIEGVLPTLSTVATVLPGAGADPHPGQEPEARGIAARTSAHYARRPPPLPERA